MRRFILVLMILILSGCIDSSDDNDAPNAPGDNRANRWVRGNPLFVSAINVSMGQPPAAFVNNYYAFGANAVHLWADGLPFEMKTWRTRRPGGFRFVSWVAANGRSPANGYVIGNIGANYPGRIGYQIGDEPAGECQTEACAIKALNGIAQGINQVRSADPNGLIIVNFKRSSFLTALLTRYGNLNGDIISYSHYPRTMNAYRSLETVRKFGIQQSRPVWAYLKTYRDQVDQESISASDMRWNAFSGLLYGFKGFTWFVYNIEPNNSIDPALFNSEGSFNAARSSLWSVAAQINGQLRRLGRSMSLLYSSAVRFVPVFDYLQPPGTTKWYKGSGDDPYITDINQVKGEFDVSVGFFKDADDEIYFMVQNVSHDHWLGDSPVNYGGRGTVQIEFDFSGAPAGTAKDHLLTLNKDTGTVQQINLTSSNGTTGYINVTLGEGDVKLFKYATGRSFAMQ